ncbi:hypothetical protein FB567DRAFT_231599 [Paraphoma chrysanthemicola]|uniref:Uncharacterized protein n=1 Tax=Paraphoma chrysanthemicola TaxID=798071 RepID=A0A8K0RFA2_9PLEO|nr:hypothetical protein FB567DRAFT_231599 [Paraphoma chrysanthemicola]
MNWTGGTLQRTKHANKGVIQKQKAYFARARTHLQNGAESPDVPFRPSYLQNYDSFELAGHLPLLGSGSVRHTGHSVTQRRDSGHRRGSPGGELQEFGLRSKSNATFAPFAVTRRVDPQLGAARRPVSLDTEVTSDERPNKRKVLDADVEVQLLQANKKRLLQQRDWIGVAPSDPVKLRRLPSEEKRRHGRRRKVEGQHVAITRRGEHMDPTLSHLQPTDDRYANAFITSSVQPPLDPIRVRIGTDALTNACSTQPGDFEQSQTSSDPMLFDQQNDAGPQDQHRLPQLNPLPIRKCDSTNKSFRQATDSKHAGSHNWFRSCGSSAHCRHKQEFHRSGTEQGTPMSVKKGPAAQNTSPKTRITRNVKGNDHPLRFVFESSTSPTMNHPGNELQQSQSRDPEHSIAMNETDVRHSTAMRLGTIPEPSMESDATAANTIVNAEAGALLLEKLDQSSSRSSPYKSSILSVVHDHPTVHHREVESTKWSQHAIEGNQTRVSSSSLSVSLPALNRHALLRFGPPAHALKKGLDRCHNSGMQEHDADEQVWHDFIFSSDEESSSEAMQPHVHDSEQRPWQGSSSYLPLSVAVSSIRSTPFRPISGHASHKDVHDNANPTPAAGSRTFNALDAVSADSFEALSEHEETMLAAHSATGEPLVTHASMLNNVSWDTSPMSPRMLSRAETSRRGLDHAQRATGTTSQQAQASSDEGMRYCRQSPQYRSSGSFDEGLDLIDADAF